MKALRKFLLSSLLALGLFCQPFQESPFDPNGQFASLLTFLRLVELTQATQANLLLEFRRADNSAYSGNEVRYAIQRESQTSEPQAVFASLTSGNSTVTTLDATTGQGFFQVFDSGNLLIEIYNEVDVLQASLTLRIFPGMDSNSPQVAVLSGDVVLRIVDVATARGDIARVRQFANLGVANERSYARLLSFTETNQTQIILASSPNGYEFDRYTRLLGITETNSSIADPYTEVQISAPIFDGLFVTFFLNSLEYNGGEPNSASRKSYYVQFLEAFPPAEAVALPLPAVEGTSNYVLVNPRDYRPTIFNGRFVTLEEALVSGNNQLYLYLRTLDGSNSIRLNNQGCQSTPDYKKFITHTVNGVSVLHCAQDTIGGTQNASFSHFDGSVIRSHSVTGVGTAPNFNIISSTFRSANGNLIDIQRSNSSPNIAYVHAYDPELLNSAGYSNSSSNIQSNRLLSTITFGSSNGSQDYLYGAEATFGKTVVFIRSPDFTMTNGLPEPIPVIIEPNLTSSRILDTVLSIDPSIPFYDIQNFLALQGTVVYSDVKAVGAGESTRSFPVYTKPNSETSSTWAPLRLVKFR